MVVIITFERNICDQIFSKHFVLLKIVLSFIEKPTSLFALTWEEHFQKSINRQWLFLYQWSTARTQLQLHVYCRKLSRNIWLALLAFRQPTVYSYTNKPDGIYCIYCCSWFGIRCWSTLRKIPLLVRKTKCYRFQMAYQFLMCLMC